MRHVRVAIGCGPAMVFTCVFIANQAAAARRLIIPPSRDPREIDRVYRQKTEYDKDHREKPAGMSVTHDQARGLWVIHQRGRKYVVLDPLAMKVEVSAQVSGEAGGNYVYRYGVSIAPGSLARIQSLTIVGGAPGVPRVCGDPRAFVTDFRAIPELRRHYHSEQGWSWPGSHLSPGRNANSLELRSMGLPAAVTCEIRGIPSKEQQKGKRLDEEYGGGEEGPGTELAMFLGEKMQCITIGPGASPESSEESVSRLKSYVTGGVNQGWIENPAVVKTVSDGLDALMGNVRAAQWAEARARIEELLTLAEKENGKPGFESEAYALLRFNLLDLRDRLLPKP